MSILCKLGLHSWEPVPETREQTQRWGLVGLKYGEMASALPISFWDRACVRCYKVQLRAEKELRKREAQREAKCVARDLVLRARNDGGESGELSLASGGELSETD